MDVFLVRHGEAAASWNEDADPGLSANGQRQAREAAALLQSQLGASATLVSSPLRRARETAEPLAQALGRDVRIDAAFREIPAPVPLPQRQGWLRNFMRQEWGQQEQSLHQWRSAALQALQNLSSPTVVFSHFLLINTLVGCIQQRQETLVFWPDNGSVTHLRCCGGELQLVSLGREMNTHVN